MMSDPYWRVIGKNLLTQINTADDLAFLILDLQFIHREMVYQENKGKTIPLSEPFGKRMNQNDEETIGDT